MHFNGCEKMSVGSTPGYQPRHVRVHIVSSDVPLRAFFTLPSFLPLSLQLVYIISTKRNRILKLFTVLLPITLRFLLWFSFFPLIGLLGLVTVSDFRNAGFVVVLHVILFCFFVY